MEALCLTPVTPKVLKSGGKWMLGLSFPSSQVTRLPSRCHADVLLQPPLTYIKEMELYIWIIIILAQYDFSSKINF